MSYLALARRAVPPYERNEKTPAQRRVDSAAGYERNELHEKTPVLTPNDAERLKARIVELVTVDPADFDRPAYEDLLARYNAIERCLS